MVLVVIILIFTSIRSLQTWDIAEDDHYDLLQNWGIRRVKRNDSEMKIKDMFPEVPEEPKFTCDMLYQTKEAPFTAIILFKTSGRLLCMGSIVDHLHILSSRRCYEKIDTADLRVLVGFSKPWWGSHAQIRRVLKIIRHEYEVALLRLKEKIIFTEYVQATRLPATATKMEIEFKKAFPPPYSVVGFLVDRYDVPGDFVPKDKIYEIQEDDLTDFDECKLNYTKLLLDSRKLFCTLGNATYCWGGWGSPVLKKMTTYLLQIGVVIADNCTSDTTGPFLVARTDVYGDWIRGNSFQGHQPT